MREEMVFKNDQNYYNTIILPKDKKRREQLSLKLEEYKKRIKVASRPSTACKIVILRELLQNEKVQAMQLFMRFNFDHGIFNVAFRVIEDYCKTGGKNVRGGTGLPLK